MTMIRVAAHILDSSEDRAMTNSGRKHVLDGFTALDFTQFVAGPTVTKLMAEMGAEVIQIERPGTGDAGWRTIGIRLDGKDGGD